MTSSHVSQNKLITSPLLKDVEGVTHGFGVRGIGIADYLDSLGIPDRFLVETDQVHGNTVHYLMWPKKGPKLAGDAYITDRPGMVCFVRTADCVPILIADTKRPAVAAIHAGWRGTAEDIAAATLQAMRKSFGTDPADCVAVIGPSICGECYEVGDEVIQALDNLKVEPGWRVRDHHVDLAKLNAALLQRAGITSSNIDILPQCTRCDETFASWRRDRDKEERQFSFILLK